MEDIKDNLHSVHENTHTYTEIKKETVVKWNNTVEIKFPNLTST